MNVTSASFLVLVLGLVGAACAYASVSVDEEVSSWQFATRIRLCVCDLLCYNTIIIT